jgi:hypothetical protein
MSMIGFDAPGGGGNLLSLLANIPNDAYEGATPPSEQFVDWLHGRASVGRTQDIHHALGFQESQASPGNHRHNGKDSLRIIPEGEYAVAVNLTVAATTSDMVTAINKLNDLCRTYLGAG